MSGLYRLIGMVGSPYSMKMRAIMRYRRLPFLWTPRVPQVQEEVAHVKPPIIPILQYPEDGSYHVDSTPLAFELEKRHPGQRSIIPDDPGLAFLSHLVEDMADEWVTKAMYIYRWWRQEDQDYCSQWLTHLTFDPAAPETIDNFSRLFRERQVGRLELVGCTEKTRPLIEESYVRVLDILERNLSTSRYLFGSRPALADFGLFGQLFQLSIDPTPQRIMREKAPGVSSWISWLDDASGEQEEEWIDPDEPLPKAVLELLQLTGEIYLPFLLANANAIEQGKDSFSLTLAGHDYSQGTFKYQVKCLGWIREEYATLNGEVKERVDKVLSDTGCIEALSS
jgi:glutathione S-transferase